ncbi:hypothetical protein CH284_04660 [Rhodococcus sp. 06-156-3]|nr:hypothetical protein CH284_04660 [Rhodococcus sp. 06-156-3]OZF60898.1 hypothetical protein CH290_16540 [Rhodococcus sp. 06-156-4]
MLIADDTRVSRLPSEVSGMPTIMHWQRARLTVLAEDPGDNHNFSGAPATALSGLVVNRLRWPADQRPASGAALHAKVVVIDRSTALITSANITRRAAGDNIETGLLVRGGDIPRRLAGHVDQLLQRQVFRDAR